MIDEIKHSQFGRLSSRFYDWLHREMAPTLVRERVLGASLLACLLATVYWLGIASDRFVSEARVIIQRTDLSSGQSMDFSSLLAGMGDGNRADQVLLRDYLLSVDVLEALDRVLNLRAHYSNDDADLLSRMWFEDAEIEWFHRHYLKRTSVEFDEFSGVLVIHAQAYDAETANAVAKLLVAEGEAFMNRMVHHLAREQVEFLERQVDERNERMLDARDAVLTYQNEEGLVAPQATSESVVKTIAQFEAERARLEAERSALEAYLVEDHPSIIQLTQQIQAIEKQIKQENIKLTAMEGETLNRVVERYERLELDAEFAEEVYRTALIALEKGRVEATRMIKKVSVIQTPTMPEYPLEPRRFYNTVVFILVTMLLAGVIHMLAAIVRDHKD